MTAMAGTLADEEVSGRVSAMASTRLETVLAHCIVEPPDVSAHLVQGYGQDWGLG